MKTSELRIGNLISITGIPSGKRFVTKINSGSEIDLFKRKEYDIKPIPLSVLSVKKLSFTPESSLELSFIKGDYKIWVDKLSDNGKWYFVWKKQHIIIDYVHQLQNLYFALTQEELTIKELSKSI